jgi:cold shock CspA family protein
MPKLKPEHSRNAMGSYRSWQAEHRRVAGPNPAKRAEPERGKVKWYDAKNGFGFVIADAGDELWVPLSALGPITDLAPGERIPFHRTRSTRRPDSFNRDLRVSRRSGRPAAAGFLDRQGNGERSIYDDIATRADGQLAPLADAVLAMATITDLQRRARRTGEDSRGADVRAERGALPANAGDRRIRS